MLFSCPAIQNGQPFLSSRDAQPGWQPVAWPAISHSAHSVAVLKAAKAEWEADIASSIDCDSDGYFIPTREE
jgi:hypothetical protein